MLRCRGIRIGEWIPITIRCGRGDLAPTGDVMRFRIPPAHRETVSIVRKSAFESAEETTVAEDVVCMIQPVSSNLVERDATRLREGVPIQQSERVALLSKPNPDIAKGDFLVCSDSSQFRIVDVLQVKGSPVMRLYLRGQGVL